MRFVAALAGALCIAATCACSRTAMNASPPGGGANNWTVHGVLRVGAFGDLDNLNPILSNEAEVSDVANMVFSGLITYDDHSMPIPDVALAVPTQANGGISADGKTITYHLRRGVRFSDGAPLTSADVKFTWQQIISTTNNVGVRFPYDEATAVDTPDAYTVVAHLKAPSAPFVALFMANGLQGAIVPKHVLDKYADLNRVPFNTRPIGSGPFAVRKWEPGVLLDLVPNPYYWRGRPKLREIQFRIIPSENTLLTAIRSHEIDLYTFIPEAHYASVKSVAGYRTHIRTYNGYAHLTFNTRRSPLDDVRVRRAIAYAIDWRKLVNDVYLGIDKPGMADQSPESWAYDPHVQPYPHDPVKAAALLADAGWRRGADGVLEKNGRRFEITISAVTGAIDREKTEVLMQRDLRAVGIDLTIRNYPSNMLFATYGNNGVLTHGKFDLTVFSFFRGPDPDDTNLMGPDRIPPNGRNMSFYADPDVGTWLQGGITRYSPAQRRPYYWKIQERIHDAVPFHAIYWWSNIDVENADLRNFKPVAVQSDYWNCYEWSI